MNNFFPKLEAKIKKELFLFDISVGILFPNLVGI